MVSLKRYKIMIGKVDIDVENRMTWDEMIEKYPEQWIGVVDAEYIKI